MKDNKTTEGQMTVGQLAKHMNTTVRTLQYYDTFGLLTPSATTAGGRRLYSARDVVRLHEIQSLKYLGFSLDEIKEHLTSMETPRDVAAALADQAVAIQKQIDSLTGVLASIETLRHETLKMNTVNWSKYADIVYLIRHGGTEFWFIKHFNDKMIDHIHTKFDEQTGLAMLGRFGTITQQLSELKDSGIAPDSPAGRDAAEQFWHYVMDFTGGDPTLLPALMEFAADRDGWDSAWKRDWEHIEDYMQAALNAYFVDKGINPFEAVTA